MIASATVALVRRRAEALTSAKTASRSGLALKLGVAFNSRSTTSGWATVSLTPDFTRHRVRRHFNYPAAVGLDQSPPGLSQTTIRGRDLYELLDGRADE